MGSLRALPRVFLPGVDPGEESFELPPSEVEKFRKVLRLREGDPIAVLPNDGSLIRCEFRQRRAWPVERVEPGTEHPFRLTLAQALPKGDRLETVLRMGTELGVAEFVLFPAERSVVRWDANKRADRLRRLDAIVREAAEQSFRTQLPVVRLLESLDMVLNEFPQAIVLSEVEGVPKSLSASLRGKGDAVLVVGPEGGWAPRELALIGDRGVSLGPLVLRTDTAGVAAASVALLGP